MKPVVLQSKKNKHGMKKVMVFGTFDIFHEGHKNFLNQAKKYGDYLIVVVARDKTVLTVKGRSPKNNEKQRLSAVIKNGLADKAVLGGLNNKYKIIEELKPDIICLGYDQMHFTDGLKRLGIKTVKLKSYKPNIYKTSKLVKNIHNS